MIHVLPAGQAPGGSSDAEDGDLGEGELDTPGRTSGLVDLDSRVTLVVDPPSEWRQMVDGAVRARIDPLPVRTIHSAASASQNRGARCATTFTDRTWAAWTG